MNGGEALFDFANGMTERQTTTGATTIGQSTSRRRPTVSEAPPLSPLSSPNGLHARKQRSRSHSSSQLRRGLPVATKDKLKRNARSMHDNVSPLGRISKRGERAAQLAQLAFERQFRRHGRWIARHPVQTLLYACIIITSLFYPAVGIYLWSSKGGPGLTRGDTLSVWRSLSTPLLDSFASSGRKHHNSLRDLRMIWDDAPDLRAIDARDVNAYMGGLGSWSHLHGHADVKHDENKCRSIRLEHVFVTTEDVILGLGPRYGALHNPIIRSALNLQRSIEAVINSEEGRRANVPACVRDANGECLTLSPLSFWSMDKDKVLNDAIPTNTILGANLNHSDQGIPITLSTTLAGRSHLFRQLPRAEHLALTFFLEDDSGCEDQNDLKDGRNPSHEAWSTMLRNITGRQVSLLSSDWHTPKKIILQFTPRHPEESFPTQKVFLAVAYIAMIVWLTRSLIRIRNVYSPFGLAFTAFVELVISMTLAISICALFGVRLTLIPWEILPFVIVVIGSENMFALTNAIISTPISLNVSSRLAAGFAKVGLPIAVTVASDVTLMALIAFFVDVQAVREFCIFAIFALIVDFFMQFSFYATVLSIDMQRLELADLLSQDNRDMNMTMSTVRDNESNLSESASDPGSKDAIRAGPSSESSLILLSCRAVWRARTARTASMSLLLAFMAGIYLYHGTGYSSSLLFPLAVQENERAAWNPLVTESLLAASAVETDNIDGDAFHPFSHLSGEAPSEMQAHLPWWHRSPSARLWQALNPTDSAALQVKIEPWTVVSLPSGTRQHVGKRNFASWALFRPRVRAIIWFAKLVLLPIVGTTALLWLLLLYLLKDTELLDANQVRSRAQDQEDEEDERRLSGVVPQDHDRSPLIDVSTVICGDAHDADVTLLAQSGPFVVSIDGDSTLQAVRMSKKNESVQTIVLTDVVRPWAAPTALAVHSASNMIAVGHSNGTTSLFDLTTLKLIRVIATPFSTTTQPGRISQVALLTSLAGLTTLFAFYTDGRVYSWDGDMLMANELVSAVPGASSWTTFNVADDTLIAQDLMAMASSNGVFAIYELTTEAPYLQTILSGQSSDGIVRSAVVIAGKQRQRGLVAVGTVLGKLALYDIDSGLQVSRLELSGFGPARTLRSIAIDGQGRGEDAAHLIIATYSGCTLVFRAINAKSGSPLKAARNGLNWDASRLSPPFPPKPPLDPLSHESPKPQASPLPSHGVMRRSGRTSQTKSSPSMVSLDDVDPFSTVDNSLTSADSRSTLLHEAKDSNVLPTWTFELCASLETRKGDADILLSSERADLVCVRRRPDALQTSKAFGGDLAGSTASRWEVCVVDLADLLQPVSSPDPSNVERIVARAPLPLEEGDLFSNGGARSTYGQQTRFNPQKTLSFTHIGRVQAFHKHEERKKNKSAILLMFGNIVSVVHLDLQSLNRTIDD